MAKRFISPSLADLPQDVAGEIPLELIQEWGKSKQDAKSHHGILKPYRKIGTLVTSDSAGLSKLTSQKTLLEVMRLVSQPKEIVYAFGTAVGGKPIGIWAADNTDTFFEETVHPSAIVRQMIAAQHEIAKLPVQIGIGINTGS